LITGVSDEDLRVCERGAERLAPKMQLWRSFKTLGESVWGDWAFLSRF